MSEERVSRFIEGEDGLARVLREALPHFDAPSTMPADFLSRLERLAECDDPADVSAAEAVPADLPPVDLKDLMFEAPPGHAPRFERLAADAQTAQRARRDAVLNRLRSRRPADSVLGAVVSPATEAWLAAQTNVTANAKPIDKRRSLRFWLPWSGAAVASLAAIFLINVLVLKTPADAPPVFEARSVELAYAPAAAHEPLTAASPVSPADRVLSERDAEPAVKPNAPALAPFRVDTDTDEERSAAPAAAAPPAVEAPALESPTPAAERARGDEFARKLARQDVSASTAPDPSSRLSAFGHSSSGSEALPARATVHEIVVSVEQPAELALRELAGRLESFEGTIVLRCADPEDNAFIDWMNEFRHRLASRSHDKEIGRTMRAKQASYLPPGRIVISLEPS